MAASTSSETNLKTIDDVAKLRHSTEYYLACLQEGGYVSNMNQFTENIRTLLDYATAAAATFTADEIATACEQVNISIAKNRALLAELHRNKKVETS